MSSSTLMATHASRLGRPLAQWLDYIESIHRRSIDLTLDRTRRVLHRLQPRLPSIVVTIAGTNGKGTTAEMLNAVYCEAGYRVGCYTSPHLVSYCERVKIDDTSVTEEDFCAAFERVEEARSEVPLTYFEFGTIAALDLLGHAEVEVGILEVGLGGRLDAVNTINPDLCVLTSIDLDHKAWLGSTRDAIGREKAGILRYGGKVVVSDPKPPQSVRDALKALRCDARLLNEDFSIEWEDENIWHWRPDPGKWPGVESKWSGKDSKATGGRMNNLAGTLAAVHLLQSRLPVQPHHVDALSGLKVPGRQELIRGDVTRLFDVAHNHRAVADLAGMLRRSRPRGNTRAVFSLLKDKDLFSIVEEIKDQVDYWYLAEVESERGMSVAELQTGLQGMSIADLDKCHGPADAYTQALLDSTPGDWVVVFGSFYLVGAILGSFSKRTVA
ncbi:MAG: folylpolyglutamate synthase/dihydrofolate synthase family protein [Arenicellales bacterium]|jgi:dihydrofolate synthase / folylpolyglutamate synthase